jgi:hypothetical protein
MPYMGFEPTIPAFELAKTVHALERATTVTGPGKQSANESTDELLKAVFSIWPVHRLWEDDLLYIPLTRAVLRSCTASTHATPVEVTLPCGAASATTGNSESRSVTTGSQFD